ncbi:MAG: AAA family ATPase [Iphinoe sp. HA4291-MV1]|nr:AAA family ATPase [Iphinoe sp. HA4291-MV1]
MTYFGLKRTLDHVGYFETQEQTNLFKELKPQIRQGRLIAITGVVGCGKTTTLQRLQLELSSELLNIRVSEVNSFIHAQLPPGRTQDLRDQMLKMGIPLYASEGN